ncbi:MAG: hypothetical protein AB8B51_01195 [Sedimentitalea sp.]
MAQKDEFARRLKRIEARAGKPAEMAPLGPDADVYKPKRKRGSARGRGLFPMVMIASMGYVTAAELDAIAPEGVEKPSTYLASAMRATMSADDIAALEADSSLARLILSN